MSSSWSDHWWDCSCSCLPLKGGGRRPQVAGWGSAASTIQSDPSLARSIPLLSGREKCALQTPAQPAISAGIGRTIRFERAAESAIGRPGPDLAQTLLRGITERVVLIAALRERRDAARQRPAIGGEIHHRPRP